MKLLILLLIPVLTITAFAQETQYDHFFFVKKNGGRIEGQSGVIIDNQIKGLTLKGDTLTAPLSEINKLYVSYGSKALLMGGLGFLTGAVIGAAISSNAYGKVQGNIALIVVPALAGTVIGALIGSGMYYWELTPIPNSSSMQLNFNFRKSL